MSDDAEKHKNWNNREFSDSPKRLCKTINETNDKSFANKKKSFAVWVLCNRNFSNNIESTNSAVTLYCQFRVANFDLACPPSNSFSHLWISVRNKWHTMFHNLDKINFISFSPPLTSPPRDLLLSFSNPDRSFLWCTTAPGNMHTQEVVF